MPTMSSFSEEKEVNRTMDPNETLRLYMEARYAAEKAQDFEEEADSLREAIEHADSLFTWLKGGGFPPDGWAR